MTNKERIAENNNQLQECIALAGASGSGGSAPNLLRAGSTVEEFVAAMEAWQNNGTDCGFVDGAEVCKFVAVDDSGIGYFFKGSTKQLIVVTLGASVSIQYVAIGGGGVTSKTFDTFTEAVSFMLSNSYVIFRVIFVGRLRINYKPHSEAASGETYTDTWCEVASSPGFPGYLFFKFVDPRLTAVLLGSVQNGVFSAMGSMTYDGEYYNGTEITSVDDSELSDVTVYYFS